MIEYVSQDEIDRRLGLTPQNPTSERSRDPRVQVIEPEPTHDSSDAKVKVVEPDDDHELGSAKLEETKASPELVAEVDIKQAKVTDLEGRLAKVEQERDDSIAKVKTLEDSHKQEAETAKAEAKAGKAELEQTKSQLRENQRAVSNLNSKVGTLEAEIEAAKCPECGNIVGWNVLPAEKYDECEVNGNKKPILLRVFIFLVYGKRCPVCKHFEQIKK